MKQFTIVINGIPTKVTLELGAVDLRWSGTETPFDHIPSRVLYSIVEQASEGMTHFWVDENSENVDAERRDPVVWTEETSESAIDRTKPPTEETSESAMDHAEPPGVAEFLLELFITSKRCQALIGDMRERFARYSVELGRKRAARRYWAHTVRTLFPLLRRSIARAIKWGAFIDAFWHNAAKGSAPLMTILPRPYHTRILRHYPA